MGEDKTNGRTPMNNRKTDTPVMLKRREFLYMSSAGALSLAVASTGCGLPRKSPGQSTKALFSDRAQWTASLGYFRSITGKSPYTGEQRILSAPSRSGPLDRDLQKRAGSFQPNLQSASTLPFGDERFGHKGARIDILDFQPPAGGWNNGRLESAALDLTGGPFHQGRFRAWSYVKQAIDPSSRPCTFTAPIRLGSGLTFEVELVMERDTRWEVSPRDAKGAQSNMKRLPLTLLSGRTMSQPKLRRGTYFLALVDENAHRLPSWTKLQLRTDTTDPTGQTQRLYRFDRLKGKRQAVDFAYLAFCIDHADEGAV